ncbi:MAG: XdhC family protein [Atopobiaceae bacterium]
MALTDSHETLRDEAFVGELARHLEAGERLALSSILATRGSMPRHAGARMAVFEDGSFAGTIGGGHIEQMAQERSKALLATADESLPSELEWYTHAKTQMACGGDALVSIEVWGPEHLGLLEEIVTALREKKTLWLVETWEEGRPALRLGRKESFSPEAAKECSDVCYWNEGAKRYTEPIGPDPVAWIFGGGHVGEALVPVLASVGFRPVVVDDRKDICVPERFPKAERTILADFRDLAGAGIAVAPEDFVVVLTHGHAADIDVLEQTVPVHPAYIGCIGSRGKAAFARKTLVERGIPKEDADAIHLPIGEAILAVTPAEIAVSIAAEMIRCRAELRPIVPHAGKH